MVVKEGGIGHDDIQGFFKVRGILTQVGGLRELNLDGKCEGMWEKGEQSNLKDPTVLENSLMEICEGKKWLSSTRFPPSSNSTSLMKTLVE